jgi:hypothetical protein
MKMEKDEIFILAGSSMGKFDEIYRESDLSILPVESDDNTTDTD